MVLVLKLDKILKVQMKSKKLATFLALHVFYSRGSLSYMYSHAKGSMAPRSQTSRTLPLSRSASRSKVFSTSSKVARICCWNSMACSGVTSENFTPPLLCYATVIQSEEYREKSSFTPVAEWQSRELCKPGFGIHCRTIDVHSSYIA